MRQPVHRQQPVVSRTRVIDRVAARVGKGVVSANADDAVHVVERDETIPMQAESSLEVQDPARGRLEPLATHATGLDRLFDRVDDVGNGFRRQDDIGARLERPDDASPIPYISVIPRIVIASVKTMPSKPGRCAGCRS